jgi:hypothetical protein
VLRRKADQDDLAVETGDHVEAFGRMVAVLELGPEHDALVAYGSMLAAQLDRKPSASVGREYRLALVALLDAVEVDDETEEELAARVEFLRLVSTPTGVDDGS